MATSRNMTATLIRNGNNQFGVYGILKYMDIELATLERPWIPEDENGDYHSAGIPNKSCVPAGLYKLEHHQGSAKWTRDTWALVNNDLGVYHWNHPDAKRTVILMHIANVLPQLQGCIALGTQYGHINYSKTGRDYWGVWNSTKAVQMFRDAVSDHGLPGILSIQWGMPEIIAA